ncbi:MAG: cobalamin-binding protein [Tissierellaceae bacterium]
MIFVLVGLVGCTENGLKEKQDVQEPIGSNEENISKSEVEEVEDDFGNIFTLGKVPERIISLSPSNTEILFALGLGDKIVGVTTFCDYPEEALEKEKIGNYSGINLEKIIELQPDLVLSYGPGEEENNKRLKEVGIPVLGYLPESIDEVIENILIIGRITGTEKKAEELTNDMLKKKDEIVEKVKGTEKKRVFYEIWHEPLQAAGPGSFMDSLIQLANGDNIAKDAKGEYPQYDIEQLIERDPEVYLTSADIPEKTIESILERPGYSEISAIKQGRVYILDANITSRPGPRIVEALELVARAIHPEVFE